MIRRRNNVSVNMRGFTLIEVISVVVILSILAVLGSKFVLESTKSYQSTQNRALLLNTGRQALERMSRQLRDALPYSVRVVNSGACVEFMPIAAGGNYLSPVPDSTNGSSPLSSIAVSPHVIDFGSALYVSIGALSDTELYGATPVSRATLSSRTSTQLTLSAAKRWQRNSLGQRFYLLDNPQAFCIVANQLRFYSGQDITSASVDTSTSSSLLASNVSSASTFGLTGGSENRNTNVLFNITFASANESVVFNQSVMIRNVP